MNTEYGCADRGSRLYSRGGAGRSIVSVCPLESVESSSMMISGSLLSVICTVASGTALELIKELTLTSSLPESGRSCCAAYNLDINSLR
ncbi:MAG: hypothetical protein MR965_05420 [Lachnospiraceae bacterium]|nr:hypothetical protein [Lachnospiraceae bacterium]